MAHISKDKTTGQPVCRNSNGRIISRHATQGEAVRARDEALRQHNRKKARRVGPSNHKSHPILCRPIPSYLSP